MARILLVSDSRSKASDLRSILSQDGLTVEWLKNADQWRDVELQFRPEVLVATPEVQASLLDIERRRPRGFPAPLLFVQKEDELARDVFLEDRFVDRLTSPFMVEEFLARVDALIRARRVINRGKSFSKQEARHSSMMSRMGARLRATLGQRVPRFEKPLRVYQEVAARIADWADRRDVFEPGHAERVSGFCGMIAEKMEMDDHSTVALVRAAMLHDVGKVALPVEVLHQQAPLREEQVRLIRTHPQRGAALLSELDPNDTIADTILYHHEQPDGNGYYGLKKAEIPVSSAILGVAECYDAMTTTRLREPMTSSEALSRLREMSGAKFSDVAVAALIDAVGPSRPRVCLSPDPLAR